MDNTINHKLANRLNGEFNGHILLERCDKVEYELPTMKPTVKYYVEFNPLCNNDQLMKLIMEYGVSLSPQTFDGSGVVKEWKAVTKAMGRKWGASINKNLNEAVVMAVIDFLDDGA